MTGAVVFSLGLSAGVFGVILWRVTAPSDRLAVGLSLMSTLPMSWLMFHFVRMPLDGWVSETGTLASLRPWIQTLYAPLTEEPAKLWILLVPCVRRRITGDNVLPFALALGLGFGLGEIVTVAGLITAASPGVAALPWYQLGGFITERFMTMAVHASMTGVALALWRRGPGLAPGLAAAMLAHFAVNFPLAMAHWGWLGRNQPAVAAVLFAWVLGCFLASGVFLARLHRPRLPLGRLLNGRARCPSCGEVYDRPLLRGLNCVTHRFERCPHCTRWHWTRGLGGGRADGHGSADAADDGLR